MLMELLNVIWCTLARDDTPEGGTVPSAPFSSEEEVGKVNKLN